MGVVGSAVLTCNQMQDSRIGWELVAEDVHCHNFFAELQNLDSAERAIGYLSYLGRQAGSGPGHNWFPVDTP